MADRPIIFSAAMVRALLDGRKTMTRRLASSPLAKCQTDDRLWVRESGWFSVGRDVVTKTDRGMVAYRASFKGEKSPAANGKWTPSIHMPRWASRLTLPVIAVKMERLQEITEEDAIVEGVDPHVLNKQGSVTEPGFEYRVAFALLWNALHGPGSWEANPEIVAVSFTMRQSNIDAC